MPKEVLVFILNSTGPKGGTLFSRDELIDKIWGVDVHMAPGAFDKHISAIRTALGDEEDDRKILETVPRQGFCLNLGVTFLYEEPENLRDLAQDHTTTTASEFQSSLSNADLAVTEDGTLSETETDFASALMADEGDDRSRELPLPQGGALGSHISDQSEASPSRETDGDNSTIPSNEFSFIAYTVVGILTLFLLGLAVAPQWHFSERLAYFETTLILGGIAYNVRRVYLFRKSDLVTDRAHRAVQQFEIFWTLLLLSWLCLYGVWLLKAASYSLPVVATLLNNSNSLMLALCYFVLNEPTVSKDQNSDRHGEEPLFGLKTVFGVIVVLVFALIEKLALVKFQVDTDKTTYILTVSDLVSGIVGGIAMSLFISRLHSRLLGESTLLPIIGLLLYLYAAIQPFYFIVNQPAEIPARLPAPWPMVLSLRPGIIGLALILKLVMFLYVTAIIRRDRLLFYMINAKRIYSEVEAQWRKSGPR
jgi:DNA-binding winged helix-turn-helix (wHTH) protein